ncbi:hypothetical protein [Winogradskyella tangerina]|uniref:hypothetical protein n=1 Tax=Winogradskyella tangerina TaxID=2023240 RepID=UPI000DBE80B0|nr:hypothetical protein [Winogradskyella tangerina]
MEKTRFCKHCKQQFVQRRSNHLYCNASCRTKASYKRNGYKYISGHYEKSELSNTENLPELTNIDDLILVVQSLEKRIEELNNRKGVGTNSLGEAALGTIAADAGVYAAKKLFAPKSLPATKGDIIFLRKELNELKIIIRNLKTHFL